MKTRPIVSVLLILILISGCGGGGGGGGSTGTPNPSITTSTLPGGTVETGYTQTLTATGGTTPYTWSLVSGSLPAGLTLNASTGAVTGTPTTAATYNFTVQVTGGGTATKALSIVVAPAPVPPSITTSTLPGGTVGTGYTQTLTATGGTTPYTWSLVSGSLPAGLTLNASTGAVTGTPTAAATYNFTVQVTGGGTATKALTIVVAAAPVPPSITTSFLPDGVRGDGYDASLSASGGTPPYTWSVVNPAALPPGISLLGNQISGTPTVKGRYEPEFLVTDSLGVPSVSAKRLPIRISVPLVLFVADSDDFSIKIFDDGSIADGVSAWTREIKGGNTTLGPTSGPPLGLSYDTTRSIVYVARGGSGSTGAVIAFLENTLLSGDVAPSGIINGGFLASPADVFIDGANDRLYVADSTTGEVTRYDDASTVPTWSGNIGGISPIPVAIYTDISRNKLYVVRNQVDSLWAFQNFTLPVTAIAIDASGVGLVDVKIDGASDTAYCSDYLGGRIFVIENVSTKSGTVPPDRTIKGLLTPGPIFVDIENDQLFVSDSDRVLVVDNLTTVDGDVTSLISREITGFFSPQGITGYYK